MPNPPVTEDQECTNNFCAQPTQPTLPHDHPEGTTSVTTREKNSGARFPWWVFVITLVVIILLLLFVWFGHGSERRRGDAPRRKAALSG